MCLILSRSVYSGALGRQKTPNFAIFWISAFCDVASVQRKLNMGVQLQTFLYPRVSRLFLHSYALKTKLCAQVPSFTSPSKAWLHKHDGHTQTKNLMFLAVPVAGEIQTPPNLA